MRKTNTRHVDLVIAFIKYFIFTLVITSAAMAGALILISVFGKTS